MIPTIIINISVYKVKSYVLVFTKVSIKVQCNNIG